MNLSDPYSLSNPLHPLNPFNPIYDDTQQETVEVPSKAPPADIHITDGLLKDALTATFLLTCVGLAAVFVISNKRNRT